MDHASHRAKSAAQGETERCKFSEMVFALLRQAFPDTRTFWGLALEDVYQHEFALDPSEHADFLKDSKGQ